jgi:hypothetical protein
VTAPGALPARSAYPDDAESALARIGALVEAARAILRDLAAVDA